MFSLSDESGNSNGLLAQFLHLT